MKQLFLVIAPLLLLGFSSCSTTYHSVTANPVGTQVGVAEGTNWDPDLDFSFMSAAENGDIQRIGTTEFKVTNAFIFVKYRTIVTGE